MKALLREENSTTRLRVLSLKWKDPLSYIWVYDSVERLFLSKDEQLVKGYYVEVTVFEVDKILHWKEV